jgi:hypothetical protein
MVSIAAHPIRAPTAQKFAVGYQQPTTVAHRVAVPLEPMMGIERVTGV